MNILILGGTEFIGKTIVESIIARNHKIILMNRGTKKIPDKNRNIIHLKADRNNPNDVYFQLTKLDLKIDIVIDISTYTVGQLYPIIRYFDDTNIKYIFISTVYVYEHYSSFIEDQSIYNSFQWPIKENSVRKSKKYYGYNKRICEDLLLECSFGELYILRLAPVVGKNNNNFYREMKYYNQIVQNGYVELPRNISKVFHYCHVDHVVNICCQLFNQSTKNSIYNIGYKGNTNLEKYIGYMFRSLNKSIDIRYSEILNYNSEQLPFCYEKDIYFETEKMYNDFLIEKKYMDDSLINELKQDYYRYLEMGDS